MALIFRNLSFFLLLFAVVVFLFSAALLFLSLGGFKRENFFLQRKNFLFSVTFFEVGSSVCSKYEKTFGLSVQKKTNDFKPIFRPNKSFRAVTVLTDATGQLSLKITATYKSMKPLQPKVASFNFPLLKNPHQNLYFNNSSAISKLKSAVNISRAGRQSNKCAKNWPKLIQKVVTRRAISLTTTRNNSLKTAYSRSSRSSCSTSSQYGGQQRLFMVRSLEAVSVIPAKSEGLNTGGGGKMPFFI